MIVVEAIYENGVLKPLKPLPLKDKTKVKIKIIKHIDTKELLQSMIIQKVSHVDYKKLKEACHEAT